MNKKLSVILFTIVYMLSLTAFFTDKIVIFSVLIFILLVLSVWKNLISEKFAIVIFLVFAIGIFNCSLRITEYDFLTSLAPQNDITLTGKVVSLPSASNDEYTKFNLEVASYQKYNQPEQKIHAKTLVTLFKSKEVYKNIELGDTVSLTGRLAGQKYASNPSEFCYATYLNLRGIHSRLYVQDADFTIIEKPKDKIYQFLTGLNRIRNKIVDMHAQNIKSPQLELLGGIVFGDDAVVPTEDMRISFQNSGLTHIIAASGMNVSMIFGMWFCLSQFLRLNYHFSIVIGILSVICYTCMTGFGPPVLRASLMLILILLGKLINRKADSVNLIFIVAFLMLLFSPEMILNIGFQLSFAVTLGLLVVCPIFINNYETKKEKDGNENGINWQKLKDKAFLTITSFVFVPIIAQIFAAPIQMFYFNSFSPYSVLANISVVPTLGIVSFGGFISCLFALIKPISYVSVKFFDFVLYPFLNFITSVADFFAKLPYSGVTVPSPSVIQIILYYSVVFLVIALFMLKNNRKRVMYISIFLLSILILTCIKFPTNKNEIIFFSVDNADSALIKTSKNKYIMIDTGKLPYKNFSCTAEKIMLKYFEDTGIDELELLILSHFDADHSGGSTFITEKVKVKNLVVRTVDDKSSLAVKILQDAKSKKIPIKVPLYKEVLYDDGENRLIAIFSDKGDENDQSIINIFEMSNGKILFTGDSSVKTLPLIKNDLPDDVTVLKVAHHGAENTVSEEYLKLINPQIALISTGFNIYGHPSKNTVELLKKNNIKILRTDIDGAVKVVADKNGILLYSYNKRHKKFERIKND